MVIEECPRRCCTSFGWTPRPRRRVAQGCCCASPLGSPACAGRSRRLAAYGAALHPDGCGWLGEGNEGQEARRRRPVVLDAVNPEVAYGGHTSMLRMERVL